MNLVPYCQIFSVAYNFLVLHIFNEYSYTCMLEYRSRIVGSFVAFCQISLHKIYKKLYKKMLFLYTFPKLGANNICNLQSDRWKWLNIKFHCFTLVFSWLVTQLNVFLFVCCLFVCLLVIWRTWFILLVSYGQL